MDLKNKSAQPVLTQSLFHTTYVPPRTWQSYLTSTVAHVAIILLVLLIAVPAVREAQKRRLEHVTLIAPELPHYKPKIIPHLTRSLETPKLVVKNVPQPKIQPMKPVETKPVVVPKQQLAIAPEIRQPEPVHPLPDMKPDIPTLKPPVQTGLFHNVEQAKAAVVPKETKVGGFGDPNGVKASPNAQPSQMAMSRVGSFDMPQGDGHSGGGGKGAAGGVKQGTFGTVGDPNGVPGGTGRGPVHTGGFGEATAGQAAGPVAQQKPLAPATTPVEIISKPKPRYTDEARNLKLEGQVALEVVFQANGSIRIVRVVHGLGHGLDEAAAEAAMQVRFKPATRDGIPVDSDATIRITFQLT